MQLQYCMLEKSLENSALTISFLRRPQWCRSLLSIGGIICNFTPILPYFQHWVGWTSTIILFRRNLVKTKKIQMEHFFSPNSGEDQKKRLYQKQNTFFTQIQEKTEKKVFIKNRTLFPPIFAQMYCTPIQIIGGGYSQIIRGIYPPIPLVSAPLNYLVAWSGFNPHLGHVAAALDKALYDLFSVVSNKQLIYVVRIQTSTQPETLEYGQLLSEWGRFV